MKINGNKTYLGIGIAAAASAWSSLVGTGYLNSTLSSLGVAVGKPLFWIGVGLAVAGYVHKQCKSGKLGR